MRLSKYLIATLAFCAANVSGHAQDKKYANEYYHDFRGKELPDSLHIVGKPPPEFLKEEKEGFRITLPKTWIHEFGGVGLRTNFKFSGDFAITAAFEILHADAPPKGYGVGAMIRAQLVQPNTHGATIARVVRAGPNQRVIWDRGPDAKGETTEGVADCTEKLLRLRLRREGAALFYEWAAGLKGDDFEMIRTEQTFGADEINAVRVAVITGKKACDIDVRFIDLRIGSGGVIAGQEGKAPAPVAPALNQFGKEAEPVKTKVWLIAAAIAGGVVLLALLGAIVFLVVRRRSSAAKGDVGAAFVTFACVACGKNLKAKAAAAGKKIKCTQCGNVALVPGAEFKEA